MPRQIINTFRRHRLANSIFSEDYFIMRFYSYYLRANVLYITSSESESCEQYVRFSRSYKLAWPVIAIERLYQADNKLLKEIANARR